MSALQSLSPCALIFVIRHDFCMHSQLQMSCKIILSGRHRSPCSMESDTRRFVTTAKTKNTCRAYRDQQSAPPQCCNHRQLDFSPDGQWSTRLRSARRAGRRWMTHHVRDAAPSHIHQLQQGVGFRRLPLQLQRNHCRDTCRVKPLTHCVSSCKSVRPGLH